MTTGRLFMRRPSGPWGPSGALGHAEPLLHERARRRVLQVDLLARLEQRLRGERRQRRLVESAQDEFLLARVIADVADREDAGRAGLERGRIYLERLALHREAP